MRTDVPWPCRLCPAFDTCGEVPPDHQPPDACAMRPALPPPAKLRMVGYVVKRSGEHACIVRAEGAFSAAAPGEAAIAPVRVPRRVSGPSV